LSSIKIDIRNIPESCSSHPVIKLSQALNSLDGGVHRIEVMYKPSDIPDNIVELFLSKHGFKITDKRVLDDGSVIVIGVKI